MFFENQNKNVSMLFLSKETSTKDAKLKIQMMISMNEDKVEKSRKCIWKENGFFKEQRTDLTIGKPNFPENTLVYVNNGSITPIKGGHAMYLEFVIIGQILSVANRPPNIDFDKYNYKENEVLIFTPIYNNENGLYRGLTKKLGYVILRGVQNKDFIAMVLIKRNQKFCTVKQPLPSIFQCTSFKKHSAFLMSQNQENLMFSKMFMFLLSTLDRKEDIQKYNDHVHLHPVEISYDQLKSINNNKDFDPSHLDNSVLRKDVTKCFYTIMKEIAGISNHNLIRNSNAFMSKGAKIDPEFQFSWIDGSYKKAQEKFQLGVIF